MSEGVMSEAEGQGLHVRPHTAWLHAFFDLEEGVLPMPHRTITPFMEVIIRQQTPPCADSESEAGVA